MRLAALAALVAMLLCVATARGTQPVPHKLLANEMFRPVPVPRFSPSPTLAPIIDVQSRPRPTRPAVVVPDPAVIVVEVAGPVPRAHGITGKASWYCGPSAPICAHGYAMGGSYAAAGPGLRAAMCGNQASNCWRGRTVSVNGVPVRLIDWCQCYWHQSIEKLIDLYYAVFVKVGSDVTITW